MPPGAQRQASPANGTRAPQSARAASAPAPVMKGPTSTARGRDLEGGRVSYASDFVAPSQLPPPHQEYGQQNGGYYPLYDQGYGPPPPSTGDWTGGLGCGKTVVVALTSLTFGYIGGLMSSSGLGISGDQVGSLVDGAGDAVGGLMGPTYSFLAAPLDEVGCEAGLVLPLIQRSWLNAIIYLAILFWSFLGVALGADVFMQAIEFITSAEKIVKVDVDGGKRSFSVLVWNPTVANLTLMALGSSSPEILLAVIEVFSNNFYAGELGPSCIVGSAAFNLMVISAICVASIPDGESRKIKELTVFYITAAFSIFAYLWLLYILMISTPNIVDVWEGVVTFLLFLLLVLLAYMADVKAGCFAGPPPSGEGNKIVAISREGKPVTANDVSRAVKMVKGSVSSDEYAEAVRDLLSGPKSKAHHKLNTGAPTSKLNAGAIAQADAGMKLAPKTTTLSLESDRMLLQANQKFVELMVLRSGDLATACTVSWKVATMPDGVVALTGSLAFDKYQERKFVRVNRAALPPKAPGCAVVLVETSSNAGLGLVPRCDVDMGGASLDRGPGTIAFESDALVVKESDEGAVVAVVRKGGNSVEVSVDVKTVEDSATAGSDFEPVDTTITFAPGEMRKEISIQIMDDGKYERDEIFLVTLSNPKGGAQIAGATGDGTKAICEVTIESDENERTAVDQVLAVINFDIDAARLGGSDWCDQIVDAVAFPSEGNVIVNFFSYILCLPFSVMFALPPPPRIMGGWACFFIALFLIGALTALIGDLAAHVGCCLGISKATTAITLVAMGTSLPDTFASMSAAKQEPYADASIGNITGSNSVNVFLGLGLPWMFAAFYWASASDANVEAWHARYSGEAWYTPGMAVGFAVPAGTLGTSVAIFSACAIITLGSLMFRRATEGFELGGPTAPKMVTAVFMVLLWFAYIAGSIIYG